MYYVEKQISSKNKKGCRGQGPHESMVFKYLYPPPHHKKFVITPPTPNYRRNLLIHETRVPK